MLKKSWIVLFVMLTSCIPYRTIDIQYFDKPKQSLPVNSGKVLLLANLYNGDISDKKEMMQWALDSVAAAEASYSLGEILQSSPYYETLIPVYKFHYRTDTSKVILPLGWDELSELSRGNGNISTVISLDYMHVNAYSESVPYSEWEYEGKYYYGYLDVDIYCYWRVYDLDRKKITNSYLHRDTLLWESTDMAEVKTGKQLPGFFAASAYAGADAAEKYASLIAPSWSNGNRIIYNSGSAELARAASFAEKGDWISAAELWQQVTRDSNKSLAAKAAYDMALANEMLGNLETALDWLREAQKFNPHFKAAKDYENIINSRIDANK